MKYAQSLLLPLLLLGSFRIAHAQSSALQSGPMVGYAEMREVMLWVQTNRPAKVFFRYWEKNEPARKYRTAEVMTSAADAHTAHIIADSVQPGRRYVYELHIDGRRIERPYPLEFTTPPGWQVGPQNFTVALGSCTYVNEGRADTPAPEYGGDYEIFTSIARRRPDVMLWLGDNVYLREEDWTTRTGFLHRYTHTRSLPEMQPLLASCANYAIWDDHDYGPNDSDRGFRDKEAAREAFMLFWGNRTYGTPEMPGIATSFAWGDAEFFLLDNRWFRSPNDRRTGERGILGQAQVEWLIDRLVTSWATFKIVAVGGQMLNPLARWETHSTFPEERDSLLARIAREQISGVIFVGGDRHHTELTMLPRTGADPLYDLTVSPLTSRPHRDSSEANPLRVPGTFVGRKNFATLTFSGEENARVLTMTVYDGDGRELWSHAIRENELR